MRPSRCRPPPCSSRAPPTTLRIRVVAWASYSMVPCFIPPTLVRITPSLGTKPRLPSLRATPSTNVAATRPQHQMQATTATSHPRACSTSSDRPPKDTLRRWAGPPTAFRSTGPTIDGLKIKLCSESTNADSEYRLDECPGLNKEIPADDQVPLLYPRRRLSGREASHRPACGHRLNELSRRPFGLHQPPLDRAVLPVHAKMLPRVLSKRRNMLGLSCHDSHMQ